jgi:hypothetical protein
MPAKVGDTLEETLLCFFAIVELLFANFSLKANFTP